MTGPEGMATCVRIALGTPDDAGRLGADVWREAARELLARSGAPGSRESVAATACDCAGCATCPVEPVGMPSWLLADDAIGPDACAMCGEHIGQRAGLLCRACAHAAQRERAA